MDNQLQTTEVNYFIDKREKINSVLILSNKSFLEISNSFVKIIELKKDANFIFLIGGWITQTSMLMQVKNPIDNFIKQDIINMLTGYWSILSFEEIIKAFELERFGVYSEKTEHFQLFDCNYISSVFKKYQKWKRENKLEHNIKSETTETTMSEDEIKQILVNAVNNKYQEFLETGDISNPIIGVFQELIDCKILKMPNSETPKLEVYYQNILEIAKEQVKLEQESKSSIDKMERQTIKSELEKIQNGTSAKIEIRAKKLVLIDYFTKCKTENKKQIL
jgi:hypothetical protein